MAEENKEVTQEVAEKTIEKKEEQPRNKKGQFTKKEIDDNIIKVDLSKPPITQESEEVEKENVINENVEETKNEEVVETQEETPVIEEITVEDLKEPEKIEEKIEEKIKETVIENKQIEEPLPDNLKNLMEFMEETGGDLSDYVNLNRDVSKMEASDV